MHACMQVYGKHLRGEGSDMQPRCQAVPSEEGTSRLLYRGRKLLEELLAASQHPTSNTGALVHYRT